MEERERGAAAVVSLEEVRQARFHAEARQRLHAHVDLWLDQVERGIKQQLPMLEPVAQAVREV